MTGGNGWYAVEACVDYWRDAVQPGLYRVAVTMGDPGGASWWSSATWLATVDNFGTLVEVRP